MTRSEYVTSQFVSGDGGVCELYAPAARPDIRAAFQDLLAGSLRPEAEPRMLTFQNVILADRPDRACLYDQDGRRIDASVVFRRVPNSAPQSSPIRASAVLEDIRVDKEIEQPLMWRSLLFKHWGHFLLEGTARLWPDEPADLASVYGWGNNILAPVSTFLSAADVTLADRTMGVTRLAKVYVPTPSFEIGAFAHPWHLRAPHRVARKLLRTDRPDPRPVYFSRRSHAESRPDLRRIVNEAEFEGRLIERGVRVVSMENHDLAEQVEIMNTHRVFIGPWGSALHNFLFSLNGREIATFVLIFGGPPRNYLLVDSIVGNRAHYLVVMQPLADEPDGYAIDIDAAMAYLAASGAV